MFLEYDRKTSMHYYDHKSSNLHHFFITLLVGMVLEIKEEKISHLTFWHLTTCGKNPKPAVFDIGSRACEMKVFSC